MSESQIENRLAKLETEIKGLKDETIYLRAILSDLIYSAIKQDKFNPEFLVTKLLDYKHSPYSWISSKEENPEMYCRHLSILQEFADAIFIAEESRNKQRKDSSLAMELEKVRLYIQQELSIYQLKR